MSKKTGRAGFRAWSMRGVEDEAGVPHGSARHYFANQRGLIVEVVRHLLDGDLPRPGETPKQQVARWLGPESGRTRARYELIIASFHDPDLAVELVRGRDRFVDILVERGMTSSDATELVAALDGLVLDGHCCAGRRRKPWIPSEPSRGSGRSSPSRPARRRAPSTALRRLPCRR